MKKLTSRFKFYAFSAAAAASTFAYSITNDLGGNISVHHMSIVNSYKTFEDIDVPEGHYVGVVYNGDDKLVEHFEFRKDGTVKKKMIIHRDGISVREGESTYSIEGSVISFQKTKYDIFTPYPRPIVFEGESMTFLGDAYLRQYKRVSHPL